MLMCFLSFHNSITKVAIFFCKVLKTLNKQKLQKHFTLNVWSQDKAKQKYFPRGHFNFKLLCYIYSHRKRNKQTTTLDIFILLML